MAKGQSPTVKIGLKHKQAKDEKPIYFLAGWKQENGRLSMRLSEGFKIVDKDGVVYDGSEHWINYYDFAEYNRNKPKQATKPADDDGDIPF